MQEMDITGKRNIVSQRVRQARKAAHMTQEQLAEKVGVRRETIMRLEAGRYNPSLKLAIDISREVETPIEVLFIFEEK